MIQEIIKDLIYPYTAAKEYFDKKKTPSDRIADRVIDAAFRARSGYQAAFRKHDAYLNGIKKKIIQNPKNRASLDAKIAQPFEMLLKHLQEELPEIKDQIHLLRTKDGYRINDTNVLKLYKDKIAHDMDPKDVQEQITYRKFFDSCLEDSHGKRIIDSILLGKLRFFRGNIKKHFRRAVKKYGE